MRISLLHIAFTFFILVSEFKNGSAQKRYEDFAQKYNGMGALSEIIMSNKCIIRENFNLFFESTLKKEEAERTFVWYKLVFHQPCTISFTIIPNNENDRYGMEVFKVKNNIKVCNETLNNVFVREDTLSKDINYTDKFQTDSFRNSLFHTRQIPVELNEAVYILVHNKKGPDLGHVIDLQTCDYSYIFKVIKEKIESEDKLDRLALSSEEYRLSSIVNKICQTETDKKLGYSNFLGDKMGIKNLNAQQVDSVSKEQAKAIRLLDSLAGKKLPELIEEDPGMKLTINSNSSSSKTDITDSISSLKNDSLKKQQKEDNDSANTKTTITEPQKLDSLKTIDVQTSEQTSTTNDSLQVTNNRVDSVHKNKIDSVPINRMVNEKTNESIESQYPQIYLPIPETTTDSLHLYTFQLKANTFDSLHQIEINPLSPKLKINKKNKIDKKFQRIERVFFTAIDAENRNIINQTDLKLNKRIPHVYRDSIQAHEVMYLSTARLQIKFSKMGYMTYTKPFSKEHCFYSGNDLYYLVEMHPLKEGDKMSLENVLFQPNTTVLRNSAKKELDKLAEYMRSHPVKIRINGHTQGNRRIKNTGKGVGPEQRFKGSALKLSRKRAKKVKDYLVARGIEENRLSVRGYAGLKPVHRKPKNLNEREENMRVEIQIIEFGKKQK